MESRVAISKQIYRPMCAANPTDRFLAEVRNGGFLADRKRFDTEPEAQKWLDEHTGEVSQSVAGEYVNMIQRWNNK